MANEFTTAHSDKVADETYRKVVQHTDAFATPFYNMIKSRVEHTNNRGEKVVVITDYNNSFSLNSFDGSPYARQGSDKIQNFFVHYAEISTQLGTTKSSEDNLRGNPRYNPLVDGVANTLSSAMKKVERQALMGNGMGKIAEVTTSYSGASAGKIVCAPGTEFGNKGSQFVPVGAYIMAVSASGTTFRTGTIGNGGLMQVTANDVSTGELTVTPNAASDIVDGDMIIFATDETVLKGINGLDYWNRNTGNLFDLSRSTYQGLQSPQLDGSSGNILNLVKALKAAMYWRAEQNAYDGESNTGDVLVWSSQAEAYYQAAIAAGVLNIDKNKDTLALGFGYANTINGEDALLVTDHDNTKISCVRPKEMYKLALDKDLPFKPIEVHGGKWHSGYTSDGRVTSANGRIYGGRFNLGFYDVRNLGAIVNMPTTGLQGGNG